MAALSSALSGARTGFRARASAPAGGTFYGKAPRVGARGRSSGGVGWTPSSNNGWVIGGQAPGQGFTPTATQPPSGTYDPVLDANLGAANRGYQDTLGDYAPVDGSLGAPGRLSQRAWDDYQLALKQTQDQGDRGLADILRARARAAADFATQRGEGQHRADVQNQDTTRSFANLGARQADALNSAGASESGAALQSGEKRGANEGLAHGRIADALSTLMSHITTNQTRSTENSTQAEARLRASLAEALSKLGLDYQRGTDDSATTLAKGQRELTFFGTDTSAQKAYQAQAGGWQAPAAPKNEFSDEGGPYRIVIHGNQAVKIRPNGHVEWTRPRRGA